MQTEMLHLEDSAVEGYAMRSLSEDATAAVEQHLLICEPCRDRVTEADVYIRAMKGAVQRLQAEPERARWNFKLFPVFAFGAVAVALITAFVALPGRLQTPADINLAVARGSFVEAHGPANRPLLLHPDLAGLPSAPTYNMEIVDQAGRSKWHGVFNGKDAKVPGQRPGLYFARVYMITGTLEREFALELDAGK
jgi:hypothetical protein